MIMMIKRTKYNIRKKIEANGLETLALIRTKKQQQKTYLIDYWQAF